MRAIFFNSIKALCSIWESGKMVFDILAQSSKFSIDYTEDQCIPANIMDYDFIVVNYHYTTNNWINKNVVLSIGKPSYCIVTEVGLNHNNLFCATPQIFDHYIFLDPTIPENKNVHAFPRPLDIIDYAELTKTASNTADTEISMDNTVVIGSFGMGTPGKAWHEIVRAVCNEFDTAIIKFNIVKGKFVPDIMFYKEITLLQKLCKPILQNKPGIKLIVTHDVMDKTELVKWCSYNTINCFFYDRYKIGYHAGLCAVTDQAILSGKPLLTTGDPTFRHITKYIKPYPEQSIREAIANTGGDVAKLCDAWAPSKFLAKFESCLLG